MWESGRLFAGFPSAVERGENSLGLLEFSTLSTARHFHRPACPEVLSWAGYADSRRLLRLAPCYEKPLRLSPRLVTHARQHGIKAAARAFRSTVPTVRKWLRRHQAQGLKGLQELSRAPRSCPHKITGQLADRVVELRRQLPTFGAQRLKREWDLPLSHMAIQRILRQHHLLRPRRRRYQKKQDLAAVKATWAPFQQISADTKDLDDILHYWPQMKARGLPAVQYTAREVRTGLQFLAFASRRSAQASTLFAQRIQIHLQRCGVDLQALTWQTDNGSEFIGELQPDGSRSHFPAAVTYFGSQHVRIPPAAHTYQSDVETVHRLIEDEFFDLESFSGRADFPLPALLQPGSPQFSQARPHSMANHPPARSPPPSRSLLASSHLSGLPSRSTGGIRST